MKNQELKTIITFETTQQAMEVEDLVKENNIKARLIPVPSNISAGCGLALCSSISEQEKIELLIKKNEISGIKIYNIFY